MINNDKTLKTLIIGEHDVQNIEDFFNLFNDPALNDLQILPRLRKEIEIFREKTMQGTYTIEDQENFRFALMETIAQSKSQILHCEELKPIYQATEELYRDEAFHRQVESVLTKPQSEE